mmetsp:Transcript_55475/g.131733  ORF Transcript_55475/g.131733 Transcript_55475/m.131733 type:complete len:475 (+) Transcript_55475:3-1427(+)
MPIPPPPAPPAAWHRDSAEGEDARSGKLLDAFCDHRVLHRVLSRLMVAALEVAEHVVDDGILEDLLDFGVLHGVGHRLRVALPREHHRLHLLSADDAALVGRVDVEALAEVGQRLGVLLEHHETVAAAFEGAHELRFDRQRLVAVVLGLGPGEELHEAEGAVGVEGVVLRVAPDRLVVHRLRLHELPLLDESVALLLFGRGEFRVLVGLLGLLLDVPLQIARLLLDVRHAVFEKRGLVCLERLLQLALLHQGVAHALESARNDLEVRAVRAALLDRLLAVHYAVLVHLLLEFDGGAVGEYSDVGRVGLVRLRVHRDRLIEALVLVECVALVLEPVGEARRVALEVGLGHRGQLGSRVRLRLLLRLVLPAAVSLAAGVSLPAAAQLGLLGLPQHVRVLRAQQLLQEGLHTLVLQVLCDGGRVVPEGLDDGREVRLHEQGPERLVRLAELHQVRPLQQRDDLVDADAALRVHLHRG